MGLPPAEAPVIARRGEMIVPPEMARRGRAPRPITPDHRRHGGHEYLGAGQGR
jgi:hypothetical protein